MDSHLHENDKLRGKGLVISAEIFLQTSTRTPVMPAKAGIHSGLLVCRDYEDWRGFGLSDCRLQPMF